MCLGKQENIQYMYILRALDLKPKISEWQAGELKSDQILSNNFA